MARERRLAIHQTDDPPQEVPIDGLAACAPEPRPTLHVPLCISFSYAGRRILCSPLYDDAGALLNLTWCCPRCGERQEFALNLTAQIFADGTIAIDGCVRCVRTGCDLHVCIQDGLAVDSHWCG